MSVVRVDFFSFTARPTCSKFFIGVRRPKNSGITSMTCLRTPCELPKDSGITTIHFMCPSCEGGRVPSVDCVRYLVARDCKGYRGVLHSKKKTNSFRLIARDLNKVIPLNCERNHARGFPKSIRARERARVAHDLEAGEND